MAEPTTNFAVERLIRRAPDHPLRLTDDDAAYLLTALGAVEEAYGVVARPDVGLDILPARALMRRLLGLRHSLKATNAEQRQALGRLASAILLVDTACALAHDHAALIAARHHDPES